LDESDRFCAARAVTALWTLNIFCASKECLCFINDKVFVLLRLHTIYITGIRTRHFTFKMVAIVGDKFVSAG
jgi:hypothetical protein